MIDIRYWTLTQKIRIQFQPAAMSHWWHHEGNPGKIAPSYQKSPTMALQSPSLRLMDCTILKDIVHNDYTAENILSIQCMFSNHLNSFHKYKLLCPRGTQTCALAVANIKVNGNGKVILDTHPESDQHQN